MQMRGIEIGCRNKRDATEAMETGHRKQIHVGINLIVF